MDKAMDSPGLEGGAKFKCKPLTVLGVKQKKKKLLTKKMSRNTKMFACLTEVYCSLNKYTTENYRHAQNLV